MPGVFEPAETVEDFYTTVVNGDKEMYYGFLPPHGRTLAANEEITFFGSYDSWFARLGMSHQMKERSFLDAIDQGALSIKRSPSVHLFDGTATKVLTLSGSTLGSALPGYLDATVVSATLATDGLALTVVFSKAVDVDSADGFSVSVGNALTYTSGTGTTSIVFTLAAPAVEQGVALDFEYNGSGGHLAADGNTITASTTAVTNNSTVV